MDELDEGFANQPKPNPEKWLLLGGVTFFGGGLAIALTLISLSAYNSETWALWTISSIIGILLLLFWYVIMVSRIRDYTE